MEIVLLRHAEPEWVKDGVNISNPPLTDRGHQQAEFLASFLAAENFDEVLVSPLLRTRQTSAPIVLKVFAELVRLSVSCATAATLKPHQSSRQPKNLLDALLAGGRDP